MSLDSTVRYVQMLRPTARPRRVPRGSPPKLIEADYAKRVVLWLGDLRADLQPLLSLLREPRTDSVRLDESRHGRRVRELTGPVRRKIDRDMSRLEPDIARAGQSVADAHKRLLQRQTKAALGVDVPTIDTQVPRKIDAFVSKNLTRIRSLSDKLVGEVETIVIDAWDRGLSEAEVAAEIEKRLGVAESYARFLARDQMGSLYTQVTRSRHEELGVRIFRWWTENDGRVRPSHALKHEKIFPYTGSRAPSLMPGDEYGCRCWEEPMFDEIKGALAGTNRRRPDDVRTDQKEISMRIAIAGGPRCGKTTLAATMGEARHTDDLIGQLDWSAASTEVSTWLNEPGPWIIEGVALPRALRKWLLANPEGKPCDVVHWLIAPHEELTSRQLGMLRGCETVWGEIEGELRRRGVDVRTA